jgi:hypothetical protein
MVNLFFSNPNSIEEFFYEPCPYCGRVMNFCLPSRVPTRDHVIPSIARTRKKFPKSVPIYVLVCCAKCNREKGGWFLDEWVEKLKAENDVLRVEHVTAIVKRYPFLTKTHFRTLSSRSVMKHGSEEK